jgi:hypothetical protein
MQTTVIGCLVLALAILCPHSGAMAQTAYVSQYDWKVNPYEEPFNNPYYRPFNTVNEGYDAVGGGQELRIYSGSYPEKVTFSKQLTITAVDGKVTIGEVFGDNPHKGHMEGFDHSYKGQTHAHANVCISSCFCDPSNVCPSPSCDYSSCYPCPWVPDPSIWGVFYCERGSNPTKNPREAEEEYLKAGYDFLALTHHNVVIPDPGVDGILHINGTEDGDRELVGYNPPHFIGVGIETAEGRPQDYICQWRLDYITRQGGLAIIAHPYDNIHQTDQEDSKCVGDGDLLGDLYRYVGSDLSSTTSPSKFKEDVWMWDKEVLSRGYIRWAFAADDCSNYDTSDFDIGWIKVQSKSSPISKADIIQNIRDGNFFSARRGIEKSVNRKDADSPELAVITDLKNKKVIVSVKAMKGAICDGEEREGRNCEVRFIGSFGRVLNSQKVLKSQIDQGINVEYEWTGTEGGYIRIEAIDDYDWITYSQPIKCMQSSGS